ncbi:MAG: hypothetical protein ACK5PS_03845 [Desulfopila sp.]
MKYIVKETLISSIINALFSIAFFVGMFRHEAELLLGGTSGLTRDFLPQAFFVGLFAALPASLVTAKRIRDNRLAPGGKMKSILPRSLPLRVLCLTLASTALFGGCMVALLSLLEPITLGFFPALLMKAVYGVVISCAITPLAVSSQRASSRARMASAQEVGEPDRKNM